MIDHALYNKQILAKYQLGYVAEPLGGDEWYAGMLSIPYLTENGVKAIKFRRLGGTGSKYAQREGQRPRLYNSAAYFAAHHTIGLSEGEIDAIAATEHLGIPTVGVPGTEMWQANSKYWAPIFKDFARVFIFADGDPIDAKTGVRPGEQLAKRLAKDVGWRAEIIWCPEGQDVASMVAGGSKDALLSQIGKRDEP